MEFKRYTNNDLKLHNANFCKVRLCPMCSWRRSLKIYGQVSKVMDKAIELYNYDFIFLTLTCRNVESNILSETIDNLFKAFDRLTKRSKFKKSIKGYFRALEITHNLDKDTYHPHFHIVLAVNSSYFTDKLYYISQEEWTSLWKDSLKIDYTPIVDVRRFKDRKGQGISASIAETAKYTVKDTDYLVKDSKNEIDEKRTDEAVLTLDLVLAYRRLTAFGGTLKAIHKELNLDDTEDGDLIHTDNEEELRDDLKYIIERYSWNIGYKQYIKQS
ncbi:MAG: protein rep [Tissierellia bacterium]|nr:protein rep [Tissierellia bacterium]